MTKQRNNKTTKLIASDFDGTLTTKDTLLEFIRFAKGTPLFLLGFVLYSPLMVLMKLHLYPNWKTKQKVFSFFFKGMPIERFSQLGEDFARSNRHLLRRGGMEMISKAVTEGAEVVIISASIDNWVQPFFPGIRILGTQVEVREGLLTGRFLTSNCYGREKVRRLQEVYPNRSVLQITAYGDSRGDKELLEYADERYYKPFR